MSYEIVQCGDAWMVTSGFLHLFIGTHEQCVKVRAAIEGELAAARMEWAKAEPVAYLLVNRNGVAIDAGLSANEAERCVHDVRWKVGAPHRWVPLVPKP